MSSTPGISNIDLSNQISVAVAKKALDAQPQQGQAALELLKAASETESPEPKGSVDDSGGLDVYA